MQRNCNIFMGGYYKLTYLLHLYPRIVFIISFHAAKIMVNKWHAECLRWCWQWLGCFLQVCWWPCSVDAVSVYCSLINCRVPVSDCMQNEWLFIFQFSINPARDWGNLYKPVCTCFSERPICASAGNWTACVCPWGYTAQALKSYGHHYACVIAI
jgi:hypothetical protein